MKAINSIYFLQNSENKTASDKEGIVEENEANLDLDAPDETVLVEAREASGGCGAPVDDLEVPPIVDDDESGGDAIKEDEDHQEDD
ncbi:hypothetical protein HKD37_04G010464 [Glycine soja]